ncbi:MAG: YbbR-like domain-containing protein [Leptospira sp.]|nr:YbbR-like domain-containing protein [Leptospira sp.]
MKIFDHWKAKVGSVLLATLFYINLQNSKMLIKTIQIPIEYPKLSSNLLYSKIPDKTIPARVEGIRDVVNYHSQFMKVVIDPNELVLGENEVQVRKISGIPNSLKVTRLVDKINVTVENKITKTISFDVSFEDDTSGNFIKASHFIRPSRIQVTGPQSAMEKFNKISLPSISLKDKKESFTRNIRLPDLPKGVLPVNKVKDIEVRVNIISGSSGVGEQIVTGIPVRCSVLDDALEAELSVDEISLKFFTQTPLKSIDVIRGINATIPCNYSFDKLTGKIIPNSQPVLSKVRVLKSPQLKNIEILNIIPEKVTITYKIRSEFVRKKDNPKDRSKEPDDTNENTNDPEPPEEGP